MSNITFDKEARKVNGKEDIEWIRIWCEDTNNESLPRVALIGDSITEGYYKLVRNALKGVASVDYLATSYSVASDIYQDIVRKFVNDSNYAVVHYNYGLHAFGVDDETYQECCKELVQFLTARAKTIIATTTTVMDETLESENLSWKDKVIVRNEKLTLIAQMLELDIDDLNALCKTLDMDARNPDGVHFSEKGYIALANSVVCSIKRQLGIG